MGMLEQDSMQSTEKNTGTPAQSVSQEKLNRLFWHSRRGMLELDMILVPFVQTQYVSEDAKHQAMYDELITGEDQDLFDWFMEKKVPESEQTRYIVQYILKWARTPK
jgi:antitoxin CptB